MTEVVEIQYCAIFIAKYSVLQI